MPPDWVRRPLAWLTAAGRRLPEPVKARLRLVAAAVRAYRAYRPPATPASSPDARVVPAGWDAAFTGPGHLNPKVSVLIVTWNNVALTRQCLDSLLADTHAPDFEIVLVDNASQDETRAYLQQLAAAHPTRVKLQLNETNAGFARANNQALALAHGDDIVFLNNDTVVTRGWLGRLTHYLSNPQVGLVGPVTNGAGNEARIEPGYDTLAGLPGFAERCTRARAGLAFDIPVLALYCLAARRAVLEQLGPLDERFGQGLFEDDDLALRARRAGYRVLCAEDVYVHHWQRAGFKLLAQAEYDTLFAHNRRLFEAKWGRPWQPHA